MEIPCYSYFMLNPIQNKFGTNLRKIRKKKGYTQIQLADIAGVSRRTIDHYETQAKYPSLEKIIRIASALNVSIDELVGMSNSRTKASKKDNEISFTVMKKLRAIEKLPTRDRNAIFQYINTVLDRHKLKEKLNE